MQNINAKRIQTLAVNLDNKPGMLANVFTAFRDNNVSILSHSTYIAGPGKTVVYFYPADFNKAKTALEKIGLKPQNVDAAYVEGDDKVGTYAESLQKIAKAGVNINATDAYSINGRFGSIFITEEKDVQALWKALAA